VVFSPRLFLRLRVPVGLLCLLPCVSDCSDPNDIEPSGAGSSAALSAEERFGNDRVLVTAFAQLQSCAVAEGRLDLSCPKLEELRSTVQAKGRTVEGQRKIGLTLANLLASKVEITRRMAAELIGPYLIDEGVAKNLKEAFLREKGTATKTALLRQLCRFFFSETEPTARSLLGDRSLPEAIRVEAATCLDHSEKLASASIAALRSALKEDPSPRVKGDACTALGRRGIEEAVQDMAALLRDERVHWRCGPALAALGTRPAYLALLGATRDTLRRESMPASFITALASFREKPFFEPEPVRSLLQQIARNTKLSPFSRERAILQIERLFGTVDLHELRPTPANASGEEEKLFWKNLEELLRDREGKINRRR
jgi:hypothetical protein